MFITRRRTLVLTKIQSTSVVSSSSRSLLSLMKNRISNNHESNCSEKLTSSLSLTGLWQSSVASSTTDVLNGKLSAPNVQNIHKLP